MKSPPSFYPFDASDPIMREAADWLARRDRGFTTAEQAAFAAWVASAIAHGRAVAQLEHTMVTFDRLRMLAPSVAHAPDPDAFAPPRARRKWLYPAVAALGMAAAVTLLFRIAVPTPARSAWHYVTTADATDRVMLPDGSTLELNRNTLIDIEFTDAQRTVRLSRGEAHFQVAKNPARPFVVRAQGVTFQAVGTAFSVRLGATDVEMLVTEGKVHVASASVGPADRGPIGRKEAIPLITAGQRIVMPSTPVATPAISALSATEIEEALAWKPQVAQFEKTPLSDVVAEFNRRNRQQIIIASPALNSLRVGGSFRLDQPDAFVRLLEASFGIRSEASEGVLVLTQKP